METHLEINLEKWNFGQLQCYCTAYRLDGNEYYQISTVMRQRDLN